MDKPLIDDAVLEKIKEIVGPKGWLTDEDVKQPYLVEERSYYRGRSPMVVRPATAQEVAEVVALCARTGTPVVPQAGNTSLCGASTPSETNSEIVLSVSRLNKIREIDPINYTITAEAGCVLQTLQEAAEDEDRLFPLDLGARGTCQLGGNLSTNAGGLNVLRYGMARDLVMGLEVVLPDGRIWNGLRGLRKDNTGFDLKHLFIGAEGTLGIITAACMKLHPLPKGRQTALVAIPDMEAAVQLLARARSRTGDLVSGFEIMPRLGFDMVFDHIPDTSDPMDQRYDWYVLIELSAPQGGEQLAAMMESLLGDGMEDGLVLDGVIASSKAQADALWYLRDALPEAQKFAKAAIKHDVSVPISKIPEFVAKTTAAVLEHVPDVQPFPCGHIGDGNLHYNFLCPDHMDADEFTEKRKDINDIVYSSAVSYGGSISAEHGIGRLKIEALEKYKSDVELDLMRRIKQTLDPGNIMNPGKVLRL